MFKRRGSFKVAPGVRANWGRSGITSLNVGGVRIEGRRSRGGRQPGSTKTELLAKEWRLRPGIYDIHIEVDGNDSINLVVNGGQLTYRRMERISAGLHDHDYAAVARAFKAFVQEWDILGDNGKPLPITQRGVEAVDTKFILGLTVEIANALEIPKKPLGNVIMNRETRKPARAVVISYTRHGERSRAHRWP